ncbi:MAG: lamin tail domain-containing protein [Bacteroidales bacterium]
MNKVILLVLLMPATAFGQIIDNFERGNCTGWIQNPEGRWNTDNINSISGLFSLHHTYDNSESGTDQIGLELQNLHPDEGITRWTFTIRYGCEPSSSNNWALFLMSGSDPGALQDGVNGFALGVNLTGYDDTLRLWKVKAGIFYSVVNSGLNWQTDIGTSRAVKIGVERTYEGRWTLNVSNSDNVLIVSSSGTDAEIPGSGWLVLANKYTSTRDRLIWFDDLKIDGVFYEDMKPPEITGCEVTGRNSILLTFSEEPSPGSLTLSNFSIENVNNHVSEVIPESPLTAVIKFDSQFINQITNKLVINSLCDKLNNCRLGAAIDFTPVWVMPGDIIISEIMADPLPAVSLPAKEYLELTNRSGFKVNLKNWFITDGYQRYFFPDKKIDDVTPVIICSYTDTILFGSYGPTIGLKSFPALTDGGKVLALNDSTGTLIHGIKYSSEWYGDALKSGGGWSLEMIDREFPFFGKGNWKASLSKEGGSPGTFNTFSQNNPDLMFTGIENVFPDDSANITIRFSETVFGLPEKSGSLKIGDGTIRELSPSDPLLQEFSVVTDVPLERGKVYTFKAGDEIVDFAGNRMRRNEFGFGIPEKAEEGDILFNELLFNPLSGDPDYIEFFNNSGRIIDASRLVLVSVNDETSDTSALSYLSDEPRCILPGDFYAITTDRERVLDRYPASDPFKVLEVSSLPSMPDDRGHLLLFSFDLEKIDEVAYDEDMQYSLLQDNEGIALEKIRPRQSAEQPNWHSASEASGWGTPGVANSVYSEKPESPDILTFSSTKITPDNDGNEDFLVVDLDLAGNGNVVSITVFDETGSFVKKLTDNLLAGQEASIVWDGTGEDGGIVRSGIYILLISIFDETGKTEKWKKVCAVIR